MVDSKLRIAHICLASAYTEGMAYQDNILPAQNRRDGHDVLIVSDCFSYKNGELIKVEPEDKIMGDGVRLVRLPFSGWFLPRYIRDKIRITPKLSQLLDAFHPDVILYHGVIGVELLTVGDYKRRNPNTRLYLDSHEDFNNSGRNLASRLIQYRLITRFFWLRIRKYVDKVLYVSYESRDFLKEMFSIPDDKMEFYPLGGYLRGEIDKKAVRRRIRCELGLSDEKIVFVHAGKLNREKRTLDVLRAFSESSREDLCLIILGSLADDIRDAAQQFISADSRIKFLGWKSGNDLVDYLCASDCYLQPGTQSATLQAAICCGLPVMIYPYPSHIPYMQGNGYFVQTAEDIANCMNSFYDLELRQRMSEASFRVGRDLLDYNVLAKRICI